MNCTGNVRVSHNALLFHLLKKSQVLARGLIREKHLPLNLTTLNMSSVPETHVKSVRRELSPYSLSFDHHACPGVLAPALLK